MTENLPEQMHAPTGTAVAQRAATSNTELDASDVRLPRLKFAQYLSKVVTAELVPYGAIYITTGPDDQEPITLAKPAGGIGKVGDPVRFYVLGVRKGFSYTDPQGDLSISQDGSYPSLSLVKNQDPSYVRRTYDYAITVPEFPDLPVQFLMHGKWGGQAAKNLNTKLLLAKSQGIDPATVAFKVQAKKQEADRGAYAGAVIGVDKVAAKDAAADAELVAQHQALVGAGAQPVPEGSEPTPQAPDRPSLD
jgi:hypothetical protein